MLDQTALRDYTIPIAETLLDAASKIERNGARAVVVMENNKAMGIVSEGDILRALLSGASIHSPIGSCLQPSFKYLTNRDPAKAWEIIRDHGVSLIPIVDEGFQLQSVYPASDLYNHLSFAP